MTGPEPQYRRRPGDVIIRRLAQPAERVRFRRPRLRRHPVSPALVLVGSFALISLVGGLLLMLPAASAEGTWTSPRIALFTAISAASLTGLVVVDTGTHWSGFGQSVILVLIQLGGLGFMTGASLVFLLLGRRLSLHERLLVREAVGAFGIGDALRLARRVAALMITFEAAGALVLLTVFLQERPPGEALWLAVFHATSAFNNAGFDVMGGFQSLTAYQSSPVVLLTVAGLIMAGGLSYLTLADIARERSFRKLTLDSKLVLTMSIPLWIAGFLAVLGVEMQNQGTLAPLTWPEKTLNAFFLTVTARTAGFNTLDTAALTEHSLFLLLIFMFIGGASASVAGGVRVNTIGVLLSAMTSSVLGRREVHVHRRKIVPELVNRALSITVLASVFVVVVAYVLAITEGGPFLPLLFEAVSAFGTVGLSAGVTPNLSPAGSIIVMVTMAVGRLGPLTLAVLLAGRLRAPRIHYAEEPVRVG